MFVHKRLFYIMTYSINLSGVIFYLEADGYIALKAYLQSLHQYFANIEDGQEILVDLQTRIAEVLLENNQSQKKTILIFNDISSVIKTIGKVSDFEEAAQNPAFQSTYQEEELNQENQISDTKEDKIAKIFEYLKEKVNEKNIILPKEKIIPPKKLFRDGKRKIIGGVLAGFSYFFKINPLWLRIIYILFSFFNISASFFMYILCWIFMPVHEDLPEQEDLKKIYRDSNSGVIAGVCEGLGFYLGVSSIAIRVVFSVLGFFGGIGLFLYILLWILMPDTKGFADTLDMEGQEIDTENLRLLIDKYYSSEENKK